MLLLSSGNFPANPHLSHHSLVTPTSPTTHLSPPPLPPLTCHPHIQMTRNPTKTVLLTWITSDYNAPFFSEALQMVVARYQHPLTSQVHLNYLAPKIALPFMSVPVFHKIKFWNQDPYCQPDCSDVLDVAHVRPHQKASGGRSRKI